ncbi:hypothetical protein ACIA8C_23030 [Nocardia sp. NPDC051321]|uniref:hypothetical protein n=1 Tax=Nocardia sp. NPDC051321 TaxID=3364323 RepID=UPI0037B079EC
MAQLRDEPGDEYYESYEYYQDLPPPRELPTGQLAAILTRLGDIVLDQPCRG